MKTFHQIFGLVAENAGIWDIAKASLDLAIPIVILSK